MHLIYFFCTVNRHLTKFSESQSLNANSKCRTLWGKPEQAASEQTKLHTEMMSWIASFYECRLYTTLTWSDLNLACLICTDCQCCIPAVAKHCPSPACTWTFKIREIFKWEFKIYSVWLQARTYVRIREKLSSLRSCCGYVILLKIFLSNPIAHLLSINSPLYCRWLNTLDQTVRWSSVVACWLND